MGKIFCLVPIALALLLGYWMGEGPAAKKEIATLKEPPHPERDFPIAEEKPFAIVVYSYKEAKGCERVLKSIFEQDYDRFRVLFFDDGSQDGTFEKVQSFVLENKQDHRVILIQNSERLGPVACLTRAAATLSDREIAVPLDAKDWLSSPKVLSRLNALYQNPDVWTTVGGSLLYPSYEVCGNQGNLEELPSWVPVSFYAALFKKIRLADLMQKGRFVAGRDAYLLPLFQLSGGRNRILSEPLFFINLARPAREWKNAPVSTYAPLAQFPGERQEKEEKADVVLFSCDRPLQLFACLESIHRYLAGFEQVFVLCRASDERYLAGYHKVARDFPEVRFVFQGSAYKKDFKPLLLKTLFESSSEYVLFGTDDEIVKDYADLKLCMEAMSRTGAYGFYLRLGSHINYSYQLGKQQEIPPSVELQKGIYAWNIESGYTDWEFPHTLDMTLYRKSSLKEAFETMKYKTPNSLEFAWAKIYPQHEVGLYFERSKVVNIPLNVVSRTGNPHMNYMTPSDLLVKFEQGLKIDIETLYRMENDSPHIEYYPDFVPR